jgi:hypothetical protein
VHSSQDLLRELRIGWRFAIGMVVPQIFGAALLLAFEWPKSVPFMAEVPIWFMRIWLGGAFATPIGFVLGMFLQRTSGQPGSRHLVFLGAVCAALMPVIAVALVGI